MKQRMRVTIAVVAVAALTGAAVAEYVTSSAPSNPCAGVDLGLPNRANSATFVAPLPVRPAVSPPTGQASEAQAPRPLDAPLSVVAAENFWGSLVGQLGGNQTHVLSIVSDPNADPHEYEANTSDAQAFASAQLVIVNGVGYDDWALQLVAAGNAPGQLVLNVGALNGVTVGGGIVAGNPHLWYNPDYVNRTVAIMYGDLVSLRPSATAIFQANYASLNASLGSVYARAVEIRNQFAGTVVAATEDIFVYLANYTALDLISPPEFMEAVAEGNDPPTQSVVTFQCQVESGRVHVLVYNQQTVTPTTLSLKAIAAEHNVTEVGVTETIQPPDLSFQAWMGAELLALQSALSANALST